MLEKLDKYFKRPAGLILIVAYKGIWGLVEIILGSVALILSYFVRHVATSRTIQEWIAKELSEDPQDIFINWLLSRGGWLHDSISLGWILIIFGVVKVAIAVGIWRRSWLVRDVGIVLFSGAAVFGAYEIAGNFSFFKLIILAFDIAILFYFWQSLPKHLGPRKK